MFRRYRKVRTWLVEDNPDDIEITERGFRRTGIESDLRVLRDGREALERFLECGEQERPDIMLLDINLPRMSGFELLERIRADERRNGLPVVVLTASNREQDVARAYKLGASSYVQKPVEFDLFLKTLAALGEYWYRIVTLPPEQA